MPEMTAEISSQKRTNMADDYALDILRLRYWQHVLNEKLKANEFKIPIHLAFGHESAAVAMDRTMEVDDKLCLTHRNVAYNLAREKTISTILDHYHLLLPSEKGAHMGSMNLAAKATGIAYTSSILGNNLAVAVGVAMHRQLVSKPGVVFVMTGDGAIEEGVFWETIVFSRSHNLSIVIVVENNNCSISSTISQRRSSINLDHICAGAGIQYIKAEGAIYHETKNAFSFARISATSGVPVCVELNLSTFCQHAGPTPGWSGDPLRISIQDGLLIEDTPKDPLFHIRNEFGEAEFQLLLQQVVKAEGCE